LPPHKVTNKDKDFMCWTLGDKSFRMACGNGPFEYGSHQRNKPGVYASSQQFLLFVSGVGGKKATVYNGNNWEWCEKCGRMTGHSTDNHQKKSSKRKRQDAEGTLPPLSFLTTLDPPAPEDQVEAADMFDADAHSLLQSPAPSDLDK
jgi:hypothetical protein